MMDNLFEMSAQEAFIALIIGVVGAIIYLYLLWRTIQILPTVSKKGRFLFISMVARIFLILTIMKLFAGEDLGKFLISAGSFIVMRFFVLCFWQFGAYNQEQDKQMQKAFNKSKGKGKGKKKK